MKAKNKRNADKDKTWNNAEWSTKRSEQCPITLLRVRNVFSATLYYCHSFSCKNDALSKDTASNANGHVIELLCDEAVCM